MHPVQDEETGGDEQSTEATCTTAPDGLGPASWGIVIRESGIGTLAWTEEYERHRGLGRELIAAPHLYLGHVLTLRLVVGKPYRVAMAGCTVEIPVEGFATPFHLIKATFPFYRTGEAVLTDVLLVLADGRPLSTAEAIRLLRVPGEVTRG